MNRVLKQRFSQISRQRSYLLHTRDAESETAAEKIRDRKEPRTVNRTEVKKDRSVRL